MKTKQEVHPCILGGHVVSERMQMILRGPLKGAAER